MVRRVKFRSVDVLRARRLEATPSAFGLYRPSNQAAKQKPPSLKQNLRY
jgi:hypothetical protein